jgi:hypothetical protein
MKTCTLPASVFPHVTPRETLYQVSWNFTLGASTKICRYGSILVKVGQQWRTIHVKTYRLCAKNVSSKSSREISESHVVYPKLKYMLYAQNSNTYFMPKTAIHVCPNLKHVFYVQNWNTCCMPKTQTRILCPKLKHMLYAQNKHILYAQNWNTCCMPKTNTCCMLKAETHVVCPKQTHVVCPNWNTCCKRKTLLR